MDEVGIDVSEWQSPSSIDWSRYAFGIIRVHNGYRQDFVWRLHVKNAQDAGVPIGVYGYVIGNRSPRLQADELVAAVGDWEPELGYWSDVEDSTLDWAEAVEHVTRLVETKPGRVGVYANVGQYSYLLAGSVADSLPFWVAGYGQNDGLRHPLRPAPARGWVIHQFTSLGGPNGSGLDVNYCPDLPALLTSLGSAPAPIPGVEEMATRMIQAPIGQDPNPGAVYLTNGFETRPLTPPEYWAVIAMNLTGEGGTLYEVDYATIAVLLSLKDAEVQAAIEAAVSAAGHALSAEEAAVAIKPYLDKLFPNKAARAVGNV